MLDKTRYQTDTAMKEQAQKKAAAPVKSQTVSKNPAPPVQKEKPVAKLTKKPASEEGDGFYFDGEAADKIAKTLIELAGFFKKDEPTEEPVEEETTEESVEEPECEPEPVLEVKPKATSKPAKKAASKSEPKSEPKPAPVEEPEREPTATLMCAKAWKVPMRNGKVVYVPEDNFWEARQLARSISEMNLVWTELKNGKFVRELEPEEIVAHCQNILL